MVMNHELRLLENLVGDSSQVVFEVDFLAQPHLHFVALRPI